MCVSRPSKIFLLPTKLKEVYTGLMNLLNLSLTGKIFLGTIDHCDPARIWGGNLERRKKGKKRIDRN